ncbi:MAG: ABC transporter ATP-binding protein [Bacteroidota bacterium]
MEIQVEDLRFAYHRENVLKDISCRFLTGRFYSVIGPNGSGKSTFVRLLNKILKPGSGVVYLDGFSLENYRRKDIARLVGYVPQSEERRMPLTVFDTVMLGRRPHLGWTPGRKDREKVEETIKEFSLQHLALRYTDELSGGELQRVHIARALVQEPQILILDEPTSSLDLKHQIEVMKLLREISHKGITVIMAIHDLNLALRYADCFVLLKNGSVLSMGGKEVITEENLKKLYDVEIKRIDTGNHIYVVPMME